jgi:hypothetical protein
MSLSPGDRVGAYEVLARLGAGGMGEARRAAGNRPAPGGHSRAGEAAHSAGIVHRDLKPANIKGGIGPSPPSAVLVNWAAALAR